MKTSYRSRKNGQAATILNLFLAVFGLLLLGVFSWELSLYLLAKDQLKTCVEVAALTVETSLCSSGNPTLAANITNAENTGYQLFSQNTILGSTLAGSVMVNYPGPLTPGPGQAAIMFQFLDPVTRARTDVIGVQGAIIEADGAYCYQPIFGKFLGLGNVTFTVIVSAQAGLPRTDVVVCLDLSGVGDDSTMVTFIQRFWDYTINPPHIVYNIPWDPSINQYAQGMLSTIGCYPPSTSTPNLLQPQDLDAAQIANGTDPPTPCPLAYAQIPSPPNPVNAVSLAGFIGPACAPGNLCLSASGQPSGPGGSSGQPSGPSGPSSENIEQPNRELISAHPGSSKQSDTGSMLISPSQRSTTGHHEIISSTIAAINQPAISQSPALQLRPVADRSVGDKDLEDVFVDLKSTKEDHSLLSKYHDTEIIAQGAGPGGSTGGSGGSSETTQQNLLVTVSSLPFGANCQAGVPSSSVPPCVSQPTMSYATATTPFLGFTDLVCNLDQNSIFQGFTSGSFSYPDLAAVVEANRGNLESSAAATAAGLDTGALKVTPQAGYMANYQYVASQVTQPFNCMRFNLQSFLDMVYRVSDVHFGLVTFNGIVGTAPTSTYVKDAWSQYWNSFPGGQGNYPIPQVFLNPASGIAASNYSTISNILSPAPQSPQLPLCVYGKRDVGQALATAISQLTPANGFTRTWANRAIVLVVDGPPLYTGGTFDPTAATAAAETQAGVANSLGIPIFIVNVCVNPSDVGTSDSAYDETVSGTVCQIAGHGSKYYQITYQDATTSSQAVLQAFGNIARQLNNLLH